MLDSMSQFAASCLLNYELIVAYMYSVHAVCLTKCVGRWTSSGDAGYTMEEYVFSGTLLVEFFKSAANNHF
jgi:hypothetical protein